MYLQPPMLQTLLSAIVIHCVRLPVVNTAQLSHGLKHQQHNNHRNISDLLDNLLKGYDNSVRPDFGGAPATVEVDIMVRSMGPISEVDMVGMKNQLYIHMTDFTSQTAKTYSMDCYFRQSWVDRRLAFTANKETLALSISMLKKIWKPDTYFYNGKQSYLHTITTPNKFVRLYQDGRVLYSSRLTIKAGCPMNLEDFPMDTQRCPLKFGSFGYTTNDVVYIWNRNRQVAIAEDMKLSQFDLIATPSANQTDVLLSGRADVALCEYSMLLVSFHLQRHMGNFLIQVYGPCVLLVVLSWVSFWLNREATADRISLGITTVLTMTFLGLEARTDLPKVPYPTALDFFVFLSFGFIFATIIQFAVVHYFTKYGSGECYFSSDLDTDSSSDDEDWDGRRKAIDLSLESTSSHIHTDSSASESYMHRQPRSKFTSHNGDSRLLEVIPLSACIIPPPPLNRGLRPPPWTTARPGCARPSSSQGKVNEEHPEQPFCSISGSTVTPNAATTHRLSIHEQIRRRKRRTPRYNSVSKIDRASRLVFPLCFLAINAFYWASYLTRSERIHHS